MKSGFGIGDLRAMNLNKMTILLESIMVENQFDFVHEWRKKWNLIEKFAHALLVSAAVAFIELYFLQKFNKRKLIQFTSIVC